MEPKKRFKNQWNQTAPHPLHNPKKFVGCACGCGMQIHPIDIYGMARFYVKGHQNRKPETAVKTETLAVTLTKAEKAALRDKAYQLSVETGKCVTMNQVVNRALRAFGVEPVEEGKAA